jgi:hypothetical protein
MDVTNAAIAGRISRINPGVVEITKIFGSRSPWQSRGDAKDEGKPTQRIRYGLHTIHP